jgi:hypothetical protein
MENSMKKIMKFSMKISMEFFMEFHGIWKFVWIYGTIFAREWIRAHCSRNSFITQQSHERFARLSVAAVQYFSSSLNHGHN